MLVNERTRKQVTNLGVDDMRLIDVMSDRNMLPMNYISSKLKKKRVTKSIDRTRKWRKRDAK